MAGHWRAWIAINSQANPTAGYLTKRKEGFKSVILNALILLYIRLPGTRRAFGRE